MKRFSFKFWKSRTDILRAQYRKLPKRVKLENMIGKIFIAATPISCLGYIKDENGERIDALSDGDSIPTGAIVKVIGLANNFCVRVRRVEKKKLLLNAK